MIAERILCRHWHRDELLLAESAAFINIGFGRVTASVYLERLLTLQTAAWWSARWADAASKRSGLLHELVTAITYPCSSPQPQACVSASEGGRPLLRGSRTALSPSSPGTTGRRHPWAVISNRLCAHSAIISDAARGCLRGLDLDRGRWLQRTRRSVIGAVAPVSASMLRAAATIPAARTNAATAGKRHCWGHATVRTAGGSSLTVR